MISYRNELVDKKKHLHVGIKPCQVLGVLLKMAYTGRLRPKGVPFPGSSYMKG